MHIENQADTSCTSQHFPSRCPSAAWTPEELVAYALSQHEAILDDERGLAVKYWRLGTALTFLRKTFDHGQWERQLKELKIDKTKASRARAIADTFGKEGDVAGLTVKEAYSRRARKQRRHSAESAKNEKDSHKLYEFLEHVTEAADSFIDYAGFAERCEAVALLSAVDEAIARLQQVRGLLRQQADPVPNDKPSPSC